MYRFQPQVRSARLALLLASWFAAFEVVPSAAAADPLPRFIPTADDLKDAENARRDNTGRAYKLRLSPRWSDDGNTFWYRNDLPQDRREFILVDAVKGTRAPAFDHKRLAAALEQHGVENAEAGKLPLQSLWVDGANRVVEFAAGGKTWRCSLDVYELTEIEPIDRADAEEGLAAWAPGDAPQRSGQNGPDTEITFINRTDGPIELFWIDPSGNRVSYGRVAAGEQRSQHTFAGHLWGVDNAEGRPLIVYQADETPGVAEVTGEPPQARRGQGREGQGGQRRGRGRFGRGSSDRSPDGKWQAFVRDHNVYLRPQGDAAGEGDPRDDASAGEIQFSTDGEEGNAYGRFEWSPDSKTLVAFRTVPGDNFEVHLVESSPRGGGRARLRSRPYPLPGDKFPVSELNVFNIEQHTQVKPPVDRIDFERSRLHWLRGGEAFAYEQTDRGHQRHRLVEVNLADRAEPLVRNLIDEQTDTFIWTTHYDGNMPAIVTWLDGSKEIIYSSERDGWRHLYLIDAEAGVVKNQITQGDWVVRAVDRIDEEKRQIWFRASGMNSGQDPYFIHYYRINFDGTGLVALTEGNGTHDVEYSPDGRFLIDHYSRVDLPTVHELRRVDDGQLIVELERADVSELEAAGWKAPVVFTAKGRDGKTDIWGIICRPPNFDPAKSYPVLENIYAGPQGSFTPKSFSPGRQFGHHTALGFIVVQMDGMGTANRSKAFHDICWHNLKDAGFEDRILWHKAVAAKYPQYDLERLGIYGGSAGGQNAAAAVLFHGDVYKAAVAGCGCHDNRMDKASWNEQWMGYPVGPHYAECSNIDNAAKLTGKLMLIVGELDENVPTESTYRFADALIRAEKDFDLVVVPGAGHGMGGQYGERRLRDFFIRHLHGVEPLDRNSP
jgi:dipeptidyl-peptidase-4